MQLEQPRPGKPHTRAQRPQRLAALEVDVPDDKGEHERARGEPEAAGQALGLGASAGAGPLLRRAVDEVDGARPDEVALDGEGDEVDDDLPRADVDYGYFWVGIRPWVLVVNLTSS